MGVTLNATADRGARLMAETPSCCAGAEQMQCSAFFQSMEHPQ